MQHEAKMRKQCVDTRYLTKKNRLRLRAEKSKTITVSRHKLFDAFNQFMAMTKGRDTNLLQIFVSHLGQNVHTDLLSVEHFSELLKAKAGQKGCNAHIQARFGRHHLSFAKVNAAIARMWHRKSDSDPGWASRNNGKRRPRWHDHLIIISPSGRPKT